MFIKKISDYISLIEYWNKKINLIRYKDLSELFINHIIDSLSVLEFYDFKDDKTILDLGSGCGLPGIPLSIILPEKKFLLIESKLKYSAFLKKVKEKLELKNVEIINNRIENCYEIVSGVDVILIRAVGDIKEIINLLRPALNNRIKLIFYKGIKINDELEKHKEFLESNKIEILNFQKSNLMSHFGLSHFILIIKMK